MVRKLCHLFMLVLIISGCDDKFSGQDKYTPPPWLEAKIFTQIQKQDDLSTFSRILELTGYDTILDISGSYTVFAPTNEAFELFFQEHPEYNSQLESGTPSDELVALTEYQIIYNAWSQRQFVSLDRDGWVDPDNEFAGAWAYKRQTLYHEPNKSYPVIRRGNRYQVTASQNADKQIMAYRRSNKYVPIFFQDYLNISRLSGRDYEYYFDRSFSSDKLYFAGAEFDNEIPAQNGFIYKTDRVVIPLKSGEQIMEAGYEEHTYSKFLDLIQQFSEFSVNWEATYQQPGAEQGLDVDTLYDLNYPELDFNIHSELTGNFDNTSTTLQDHHGLIAPTDAAIDLFMDEYMGSWGELSDLPRGTRMILANSHLVDNAIYLKDIENGFKNLEGDLVLFDDQIIHKTYGSNCSFLGIDEVIVPRAFKSVSRPLYLTRSYQTVMYAVEKTNLLPALKKANENYAFFLPNDVAIGLNGDSSLVRIVQNQELNQYNFEAFDRAAETFTKVSTRNLRKKLLNQIAETLPRGIANKEFIRNLGGNHIIFDNVNGTVSGTAPSSFGYNGDATIEIVPNELYSGLTDNGIVYDIDSWFNFKTRVSYYGIFTTSYPQFLNLMQKAGLYDPVYFEFPFLVEGKTYTIFIPSDEALAEYGVNDLPIEELKQFLLYHFVQNELIFTDGRQNSGSYSTARPDESSTIYNVRYSKIQINPDPDVIKILDKNGDVYVEVPEDEEKTNQIILYDTDEESESQWDYVTTAVLHSIDRVLVKDSLQIQ